MKKALASATAPMATDTTAPAATAPMPPPHELRAAAPANQARDRDRVIREGSSRVRLAARRARSSAIHFLCATSL